MKRREWRKTIDAEDFDADQSFRTVTVTRYYSTKVASVAGAQKCKQFPLIVRNLRTAQGTQLRFK